MANFTVRDELVIESLFKELIELQSDTGTSKENDISKFIYERLNKLPYFLENTEYLGIEAIPEDPFNRSVVWGLVKGSSDKTLVLMNHHDAVDLSAYGDYRDMALSPSLMKDHLKEYCSEAEVQKDIKDSDWIFGRGTADMKAGIAMQMWAVSRLVDEPFEGNILFLSVGDEENLSAGMRHGVKVLSDLKDRFALEYEVAINSEPYDRNDDESPIYYEGSVGKVMPIIYAKGKTAHIGQVYSGINPTFLLSKIQQSIELSTDFTDVVEGEVSAPPTWVYSRDMKEMYDASIPTSAVAYFSVLSMTSSPSDILNRVKTLCTQAFNDCIESVNLSYEHTKNLSKYFVEPPNLKVRVLMYSELYKQLSESLGGNFVTELEDFGKGVKDKLDQGDINLQNATIMLIDKTVSYIPDNEPVVVVSLGGPLYPHVCNRDLNNELSEKFDNIITKFTREMWQEKFVKRNYFLGISDFSYASFVLEASEIDVVEENMPGWQQLYYVPLDLMKDLKMSLINIGPRGKDIHKMTERVSRNDAFVKIPQLMFHFINEYMKGEVSDVTMQIG